MSKVFLPEGYKTPLSVYEMQRALIQYRNPKNYALVHEALTKTGRTDLIGYDKKCLIKPMGRPKPEGKKPTPAAKKPSVKAARKRK